MKEQLGKKEKEVQKYKKLLEEAQEELQQSKAAQFLRKSSGGGFKMEVEDVH